MTTRIASCCCGQLTAKVSDEPIRVSVCRCVIAMRVSVEPAACLPLKRGLRGELLRSAEMAQTMSALATKAEGPDSPSARPVAPRSTTSWKAGRTALLSPSVSSRSQASRHQRSRSMKIGCILGSRCRLILSTWRSVNTATNHLTAFR